MSRSINNLISDNHAVAMRDELRRIFGKEFVDEVLDLKKKNPERSDQEKKERVLALYRGAYGAQGVVDPYFDGVMSPELSKMLTEEGQVSAVAEIRKMQAAENDATYLDVVQRSRFLPIAFRDFKARVDEWVKKEPAIQKVIDEMIEAGEPEAYVILAISRYRLSAEGMEEWRIKNYGVGRGVANQVRELLPLGGEGGPTLQNKVSARMLEIWLEKKLGETWAKDLVERAKEAGQLIGLGVHVFGGVGPLFDQLKKSGGVAAPGQFDQEVFVLSEKDKSRVVKKFQIPIAIKRAYEKIKRLKAGTSLDGHFDEFEGMDLIEVGRLYYGGSEALLKELSKGEAPETVALFKVLVDKMAPQPPAHLAERVLELRMEMALRSNGLSKASLDTLKSKKQFLAAGDIVFGSREQMLRRFLMVETQPLPKTEDPAPVSPDIEIELKTIWDFSPLNQEGLSRDQIEQAYANLSAACDAKPKDLVLQKAKEILNERTPGEQGGHLKNVKADLEFAKKVLVLGRVLEQRKLIEPGWCDALKDPASRASKYLGEVAAQKIGVNGSTLQESVSKFLPGAASAKEMSVARAFQGLFRGGEKEVGHKNPQPGGQKAGAANVKEERDEMSSEPPGPDGSIN